MNKAAPDFCYPPPPKNDKISSAFSYNFKSAFSYNFKSAFSYNFKSALTQYLGAKSSTVGRVKLYNKQTEAHLSYPLTWLELTLDPEMPYSKINFPTVYYLDELQMCIDETKVTETERFIIDALLQGCGTVDQLGRRTQTRIKAQMEGYTRRVEISEQDYSRILLQVNGS